MKYIYISDTITFSTLCCTVTVYMVEPEVEENDWDDEPQPGPSGLQTVSVHM